MLSHSLCRNFRKNLSWLHQNICLFWGNGINVSVWERWRITRKENIQSFQLVSIYFLLAIHNTAIWNVILIKLNLKQSHLHCHWQWLAAVECMNFSIWAKLNRVVPLSGIMAYASILEKQKEHDTMQVLWGSWAQLSMSSFLWLLETAFIQPLWPPLSSNGQIHAVVN